MWVVVRLTAPEDVEENMAYPLPSSHGGGPRRIVVVTVEVVVVDVLEVDVLVVEVLVVDVLVVEVEVVKATARVPAQLLRYLAVTSTDPGALLETEALAEPLTLVVE